MQRNQDSGQLSQQGTMNDERNQTVSQTSSWKWIDWVKGIGPSFNAHGPSILSGCNLFQIPFSNPTDSDATRKEDKEQSSKDELDKWCKSGDTYAIQGPSYETNSAAAIQGTVAISGTSTRNASETAPKSVTTTSTNYSQQVKCTSDNASGGVLSMSKQSSRLVSKDTNANATAPSKGMTSAAKISNMPTTAKMTVPTVSNNVNVLTASNVVVSKDARDVVVSTNKDIPNVSKVNDLTEASKENNPQVPSGKRVDKNTEKNPASSKIKSNEKETTLKTIVIKGKAPVDPECVDLVKTCHVFWEGNDVYDVMLNLTNLEKNNNKFAWLQLLEDDHQMNYYFWCRSGRVGYQGYKRMVDCGPDFFGAKSLFKDEFLARTKNHWELRNQFKAYPGKHIMIALDYSSTDDHKKEAVAKIPRSALDSRLESFIEMIFNINAMEAVVTAMKYDAKNLPLGKLTAKQIAAGHEALTVISECISKKKNEDELRDACNRFYTTIPHFFRMKRPPMIDTKEALNEKFELLKLLDDIQVAMAIINEEVGLQSNPIDSRYNSLKCNLKIIPAFDPLYSMVEEYLQNTHGHTHTRYNLKLVELFSYYKEEQETSFNDVGNKMLLWHGTRLINSVRILKDGLKIAPPHVQVNGHMFGKGVYFADMSTKSANYCYTTPENNEGVMYLCEVALGNQHKLDRAYHVFDGVLPEGHHSVMGLGRVVPNPNMNKFLRSSNVLVPSGKGVHAGTPDTIQNLALNYNEYVVYNVNQIKIKFVLRVKFLYK